MVGPNFKRPALVRTAQYTPDRQPMETVSVPFLPGGQAQHFYIQNELPRQWWALFQSRPLNGLIAKGLAHSPNIHAAQAALRQAKENLRAGIGGTLLPAINGQLVAQREKTGQAQLAEQGTPSLIFDLLNPSLNATYTLDWFGANRRTIEALCAQVNYQQYQLEDAYLTLSANIASLAITEASLRAQIKATHRVIEAAQNAYDMVSQQFQLGSVARSDVLAQETQLAQTKTTLPGLEKSLAQTRHALAVLIGEFPSESCLPDFWLEELTLPIQLPLTTPSALIRKRPDVRAAEALAHQASAEIGVATANLLPQLSFTASYAWQSNQFSQLFNASTAVWNYGGQLLQPIFNGGALVAKRRAAIAAYEQVLAQYRQTVLQAMQNVADVLRAIEWDAKTLQAQAIAEKSAENFFNLTQQQFNLGAISYLTLLQAQQAYQETLIGRIQAQAQRYLDTAALFQALGGNWTEQVKIDLVRDSNG